MQKLNGKQAFTQTVHRYSLSRLGYILVFQLLVVSFASYAINWQTAAIGTGAVQGAVTAVETTVLFENAQGKVLGGNRDAITFTYTTMTGDGEFSARISGHTTAGTTSDVYAGLMIRESLTDYSKFVLVGQGPAFSYSGDIQRYSSQYYRQASLGSVTAENFGGGYYWWRNTTEFWIKIKRQGNAFTCYASPNGVDWFAPRTATVSMAETVYIGFAVFVPFTPNTVTFENTAVPQV